MKCKYYEVLYQRKYCVIIPEDISQLWIWHFSSAHDLSGDILGNRKGLETIGNACALLLEKKQFVLIPYFIIFHGMNIGNWVFL